MPAARYDAHCAFCGDGIPVQRHRGKAACASCAASFNEASEVDLWTEDKLRALIRKLDGRGPRDYLKPLYLRAKR